MNKLTEKGGKIKERKHRLQGRKERCDGLIAGSKEERDQRRK